MRSDFSLNEHDFLKEVFLIFASKKKKIISLYLVYSPLAICTFISTTPHIFRSGLHQFKLLSV